MELKQITTLVTKSFIQIRQASTTEQINKYIERERSLKYDSDYPLLDIRFTKKEIKTLERECIIVRNEKLGGFVLSDELSKNNKQSALVKLIYSLLWKQQDLKKVRLIINGILAEDNDECSQVFYYFGKHLNNPKKSPLVDINVITAYQVYNVIENDVNLKRKRSKVKLKEIIKRESALNKNDKKTIEKYIKWMNENVNEKLRKKDGFKVVDKLLFSLGKYIRKNKKNILQSE